MKLETMKVRFWIISYLLAMMFGSIAIAPTPVHSQTEGNNVYLPVLADGTVAAGPEVTAAAGEVIGTQIKGYGGLCLDVPWWDTSNGNELIMWSCTGNPNQNWSREGNFLRVMGHCLDAGLNEAIIWDCHGGLHQQFTLTTSGEIKSLYNGKCLDVEASSTRLGTPVLFYQCTGNSNQKWRFVDIIRVILPPQNLAAKAKALVESEREFWSNGRYQERDPEVLSRMKDYWNAANIAVSTAEIQSAAWQHYNPWSAAFISWVMREAGARDYFAYSSAHWQYVADAKRNVGNNDEIFWAFRAQDKTPQVGDLVCAERLNSGITYENVDDGEGRASHCDLVTEVHARYIIVIGGNTRDDFNGLSEHTVGKKRFELRSDGRLATDHFAIVRIMQ